MRCLKFTLPLIICAFVHPVLALEFRLHENHSRTLNAIHASGEIVDGDLSRLIEFWEDLPEKGNDVVYFDSGGGHLLTGVAIGLFLYQEGIKAGIDENADCASACVYAVLGGRTKSGKKWVASNTSSRVGVHAFYNRRYGMSARETRQITAGLMEYLNAVEAPTDVLIESLSTDPDHVYWYGVEELCDLGIKVWNSRSDRWYCDAQMGASEVRRKTRQARAKPQKGSFKGTYKFRKRDIRSDLNMRVGPSVNARVLSQIPYGARGVGINANTCSYNKEEKRTWVEASYKGRSGWVAAWFLVDPRTGKAACGLK